MNTIDLLLSLDANKLQMPERDVEIKRLTAVVGSPMIFTCKAMDPDRYSEIQQDSISMSSKGKVTKIDMAEMRNFVILDGVKSPSLKDKTLCDHFGAATPKELIKKLFLPGEIDLLFNTINELSGFEEEQDEQINKEIKNL